MITEEEDLKLRAAFAIIDTVLNSINHIIPVHNEKLYAAYRKINVGVLEFCQTMRDSVVGNEGVH